MYLICCSSYRFWYSFTLSGSYSTLYFNIRYTTRAIACAVATVACAGPSRARNRRYKMPKAHSACFTDWAAIRKACPARFFVFKVVFFKTLPPDISCLGATPSHEQKCFSVGNLVMSVPHSMITVCASETPKPSTRLMSTPLTRFKCLRIFSVSYRAFLLYEFRLRDERGWSSPMMLFATNWINQNNNVTEISNVLCAISYARLVKMQTEKG